MLTFDPALLSSLPLSSLPPPGGPFFFVVFGFTRLVSHTQPPMRLSGTLPVWVVWLAVSASCCCGGGAVAGGVDTDMHDAPPPLDLPGTGAHESAHQKHCWVFTHMNKSGGQTIKGLVNPWIAKNGLSLGLYDSVQWKNGTDSARRFLENQYTVTWGAYTEGLRPHGVRPHCKWFTLFRHPVSRLVSAYYFCHSRHRDPLCAAGVLRAEEADLLTFARHWTNFGLRQFASAFILPETVTSSRMGQLCPECPGW